MDSDLKGTQPAAFFDLDLTITDRDSFRYFLKKECLHNLRNWRFVPRVLFWGLCRKTKLISLQTFKEKSLLSLKGRDSSYIAEAGRRFFENHLLKMIRPKALEKILWHKKKGHPVFIVTSCPDIYLGYLSNHLHCSGYESTKLAYSKRIFQGTFVGKDCLGDEKVARLKDLSVESQIDLSKSYAYSDHESDLPMLECIGVPIAVCPAGKLRKIAVARGWKIEEW